MRWDRLIDSVKNGQFVLVPVEEYLKLTEARDARKRQNKHSKVSE